MPEVESKNYELAYHLIPDLEEAGVKAHAKDVEDLISQNGGSIITSNQPKHVHLSYPIHNKQYAYFGLIDFSAGPEVMEKLNAQMKLQNGILRFLLIKKPHGGKDLRILGEHWSRPSAKLKSHEALTQEKAQPAKEPVTEAEKKVEGEKMEKEIEKVIEGL